MKLVANRRSTRPNEPIDRGMSQLKQSAETIGAEGPPYLSSAEHPGGVELDQLSRAQTLKNGVATIHQLALKPCGRRATDAG